MPPPRHGALSLSPAFPIFLFLPRRGLLFFRRRRAAFFASRRRRRGAFRCCRTAEAIMMPPLAGRGKEAAGTFYRLPLELWSAGSRGFLEIADRGDLNFSRRRGGREGNDSRCGAASVVWTGLMRGRGMMGSLILGLWLLAFGLILPVCRCGLYQRDINRSRLPCTRYWMNKRKYRV